MFFHTVKLQNRISFFYRMIVEKINFKLTQDRIEFRGQFEQSELFASKNTLEQFFIDEAKKTTERLLWIGTSAAAAQQPCQQPKGEHKKVLFKKGAIQIIRDILGGRCLTMCHTNFFLLLNTLFIIVFESKKSGLTAR